MTGSPTEGQMINGLHVIDTAEGMPVIFQHGLGGDRFQVAENFPDGPQFRRITVECRGHGLSEGRKDDVFSIARFADDIVQTADHLGIDRFVVGGISMGAAIALRLCVTFPQRVSALILARPAWIAEPAPSNMAPFAEVARLLADMSADAAHEAFVHSDIGMMIARNAPDNMASLVGFFNRPDTALTASLLGAIAADGPGVCESQIADLTLPTLVIGHDVDYIHPLAFAQRFGALIGGAETYEIAPKATNKRQHVAQLRQHLQDFLQKIELNWERPL